MVIDCMLSAGLTEFQVELGNVAFFNGLLHKAGITGDSAEELLRLIKDKNYFGVEELLEVLILMMQLPRHYLNFHSYLAVRRYWKGQVFNR